MEERNLELDDDGKIKLKRKNENFLQEGDAAAEDEIVIELKVAASDVGKVIGKQGRIAKAIRSVVKAASSKTEKKVVVEIQ